MGKVLNSKKESRRRVRRAVLKSLKVVTDRSDTVTDNQQEIVPMIPLPTDSNVNVKPKMMIRMKEKFLTSTAL